MAIKHGAEYDEFMNRLNERANFFKMRSTGCASVDDKRLRNWNNPPKTIDQRRKGIGFYGGAYREIEYEHISVGVRIICMFLKEIEDIPIGTTMARVEDNKLKVSIFNGSKPSSSVETFVILEESPPQPKVIRICQRCGKECGDGPFCSNKCRHKEEKKLFGEMKRKSKSSGVIWS